jgi:hypothetical protein
MSRPFIILVAVVLASAALGTGLGRMLRPHPAPAADQQRTDVPLAAPPLRLRMLEWKVGAIPPSESRTRRFEIANPGPDVWTLRHLHSTCPCATASLTVKAIAAGESAWLEVTYQAPPKGKAFAHVMVDFAAPGPVIQLTVDGEARRSTADMTDLEKSKKGQP